MTLTTYDELVQGSDEWFAARRGIVTASTVGRLINIAAPGAIEYRCDECDASAGNPCKSKVNGQPIKTMHDSRTAEAIKSRKTAKPILTVATDDTANGLMATLAAERVAGFTEDHGMTREMWRGVESEPYARDAYSKHYDEVTEIGFMRLDAEWGSLGYSPDGLVGDDGLIEIKAPRAKTQFLTVIDDAVPTHYMPQLQAGLLVSGRKWIDFVSYVGGMALYSQRVYPDRDWFDVIKAAVAQYELTAGKWVTEYERRCIGRPSTTRIDFDLEVI